MTGCSSGHPGPALARQEQPDMALCLPDAGFTPSGDDDRFRAGGVRLDLFSFLREQVESDPTDGLRPPGG